MRGKRSKQYRKLMNRYALSFNFREPYQVLVDAGIIQDAERFKMDLGGALERTLSGKIKPMITQCSIRHLYQATATTPAQKALWLDAAKTCERRRCDHHELPEPLSTLECLESVVDPKESGTNKHRYVVASQDREVRASMREKAGVPLVYINRSVMIMEPMGAKTEEVRDQEEKSKFRAGLKGRRGAPTDPTLKRKRDDGEEEENTQETDATSLEKAAKRRKKGPSGPNPLSVKKAKKRPQDGAVDGVAEKGTQDNIDPAAAAEHGSAESKLDGAPKRKRRRKKKATEAGGPPS